MQPKFTQLNVSGVCLKIFAIAFIFLASSQISIAQQRQSAKLTAAEQKQAELNKAAMIVSQQARLHINNDAGVSVSRPPSTVPQPELVCLTTNGSLASGDPTMNVRPFRDGVLPPACTNKTTCNTPISATGCFYDVISWTNPLPTPQCVTLTYTMTAITGGTFTFVTVHNGPFVPTNPCTNWISDCGSSPALNTPVTWSFTLAGLATANIVVSSVGAITSANYTLVVDAPVCFAAPCSGTPNPGNTVSSANPVCPAVNFTLSTQNATVGSGVTYVWESAPAAAGPWTPVPGGTLPQLSTTQNAATWYRVQVTCSGNTGISTPLLVGINPPSSCYCIPGATDCTDNDVITRVQFGSIDNSSGCGTGPPPGYTNYTTTVPPTDVIKGASMQMRVEAPTNWTEIVSVWIDYNQNGQFETTEYSLIGTKPAGQTSVTGNVNVPAGALTGSTRMRVRIRFATAWTATQPCTGGGFAETEDYQVNVVPCIPVTITSQPQNVTTQCSGNATFSISTNGHFPVYQWEMRPNSSSVWQLVPNTPPFSGANTSTLTLTNTPSTYNGYQFRAVFSGTCAAPDFSNTVTLTVGPLVANVNPASATICTGSVQQLTLTNASSPTTQTFPATSGLPIAIPDANAAGISHSIPVTLPPGSVISGVAAKFSIPAHTWPGDLVIVLRAPNGSVMNLSYGITATGAGPGAGMVNTNISSAGTAALSSSTAPYTGTFRADAQTSPAASLGNVPVAPTGYTAGITANWANLYSVPNGNWTLAIYDAFGGDVGSLTAWSIDITYGAPATGVWTASPSSPNTMWLNAGATIPYVAGSQAGTIYVNPTVNTVYSVVYSTATPCTSAPTNVPVNVTNPIAGLTVSPASRTVCVGGSTTFNATATGGPITWQWQVSTNGGTTWTNITGATSSTLTINGIQQTMQNYRYRVVATAAPCGTVTSTTFGTLNVNALPVVTLSSPDMVITPGETTTITATSTPAAGGANSWVWFYNGSVIPGATTNTITVDIDQLGHYSAAVVDVNGCEATSAEEVVIGADATDRLWIYPNPAPDGQFQVRLFNSGTPKERRIVKVYNTAGVMVLEKVFSLTNTTHPYLRMDIDLSRQAAGTYLVQVYDKFGGKVAGGFVISR